MAKKNVEEVYDLPDDMVFEVLSYLPAKQICKFRCINKDINNQTSTSNFSLRQASNIVKNVCGLFIQDHYQNINDLVFLGDGEEYEYDNYIIPFSSGVPDYSIIIGCNNGIVVYEEKPKYFDLGQLLVINPVTLQRRAISRPTTDSTTRILGSVMMLSEQREGYINVDYNLVCFLPSGDWDNYVEYHVYSSKENRWVEESNKRLDVGSRSLNYERPILVEEMVYLVSDCFPVFKLEPYIVGIDVEQKTCKILPLLLPLISCDSKIEISSWGDRHDSSLCLI